MVVVIEKRVRLLLPEVEEEALNGEGREYYWIGTDPRTRIVSFFECRNAS